MRDRVTVKEKKREVGGGGAGVDELSQEGNKEGIEERNQGVKV